MKLDVQDNLGRTALYHALSCCSIKAAKDLIMKGCDITLKDNNGKGALDLNLKEHRVRILFDLFNRFQDVVMDVVKTKQEKSNSINEAVYKEAVALFNQKASQGIEHLQKVCKAVPLVTNAISLEFSRTQRGTSLGSSQIILRVSVKYNLEYI